jgi:hypothetical protein
MKMSKPTMTMGRRVNAKVMMPFSTAWSLGYASSGPTRLGYAEDRHKARHIVRKYKLHSPVAELAALQLFELHPISPLARA